ncbi:MAG: NUDIX hydrolase [Candidatus Thorarchaeota archaeon]
MNTIDLIFDESLVRKALYPCDSPSRISIKDNYFTSAAVLFSIIPYETKPYELILIHRSDEGTRHRGEISFPGGKFDSKSDSSLMDTALRETKEEIGVPRKNVKIIGCLDDFPTMTRFIITPFIGLIHKDQKLIKDKREVQEILKIPIDFFIKKTNFREQAVDIDGKKFPIFYFNYIDNIKKNTHTIWGATAFLISTFIEKVYDYMISDLGLKRFKLERIKQIKEYIKSKNQITNKF